MGPFRSAGAVESGWRLRILLGALAVGICCSPNSAPRPTIGASSISECRDRNDDSYYFPPGTLIPRNAEDDLTQRRFVGEYYRLVELPSLSCEPPTSGYRLFWGGAEDGLVVTIIGNQVKAVRFGRSLNGDPKVVQQDDASINADDLRQLGGIIERSSFWTTRPFVDIEGEGVIWLFEVRKDRSYKAVTRVQPDPDLIEAARLMTTGINFELPKGMRNWN